MGDLVAYLCSTYPAVSHTFVLREVGALRRLGLDVQPFTIRRTPPEGLLSAIDREEARRTRHLLPTSAPRLARALVALLREPRGRRALATAAHRAWRLRRPGLRGNLWQLFYLAEAVLLWSECRRRSIRHIHVHFANAASDVALLTAAIGTALEPERPWTWSFTMHGPAEFWNAALHRLTEKVEAASFVACISDFCRSQLMAITAPQYWDRLDVIHCGLDVERYALAPPPGTAPPGAVPGPDLASDVPDRPRLVAVGRLVGVKGQILVVELVARLRARGLDVSAEIIGEGPMRPRLERRIAELGLEDRVVLSGALGQDRIPERLRGATAFVLPSFSEGVPVVAMEAMAVGVPVVASRIAGIPELIEDGVSGLLATPARLDEFVDATERLIREPELRARMAAAGRETIASRFDVNREARRLAALFPEDAFATRLASVSDLDQTLAPL